MEKTISLKQSSAFSNNEELMTEGVIWKKILLFSIPLILGNLLQQMYNTVDSVIVGNYVGSNALAAVGASTFLISLLIAFSMGASTGAGIVVSQFLGAGNRKGINISVHTALAISVVLGLFLSIVGIVFSPQILTLMGTPEEVMPDSVIYLKIYSGGLVFNIVYNMAAGILNAAGNSKRPLVYLGIASVLNIFLDLLFIDVMNMGIAGAAIATNISQIVSCVLILFFLIKVPESYQVTLKKIKIHKETALKIIKVGLPAGIQNTVISFSNVLVQSSVNTFGADAMAGFGVYMKIDGFNILPVMSFSMAMTTFAGQNYGAGKIDRIKEGTKTTIIMGVIYAVFTSVVILYFSRSLIGFFTKNEEVINYGVRAMKYFCPFYFLLSFMQTLAGTLRGVGKTLPPMIILLIALCFFRILWLQTVLPLFNSIEGIYILYPVSWLLGTILMILYTKKSNLKN